MADVVNLGQPITVQCNCREGTACYRATAATSEEKCFPCSVGNHAHGYGAGIVDVVTVERTSAEQGILGASSEALRNAVLGVLGQVGMYDLRDSTWPKDATLAVSVASLERLRTVARQAWPPDRK